MPFIVKWPGVTQPGTYNDDLIQNLDYAETFLEMAEAEIPDDMQGRSLVPLLEGDTPSDWRTSVYYHYYEYPSVHMVPRHYGIRTKNHKLMHFYQFDEWEFYDLEKDPDELMNVYGDNEYAAVISKTKDELEHLRAFYDDDSDVSVKPKSWQIDIRRSQASKD